eukprot:gene12049-biopygen3296
MSRGGCSLSRCGKGGIGRLRFQLDREDPPREMTGAGTATIPVLISIPLYAFARVVCWANRWNCSTCKYSMYPSTMCVIYSTLIPSRSAIVTCSTGPIFQSNIFIIARVTQTVPIREIEAIKVRVGEHVKTNISTIKQIAPIPIAYTIPLIA